jgi:diacylglycerol kinase (ATP)
MPQKIKLILNPTANHGSAAQVFSALQPQLAEHTIDWSATEHLGQAVELARLAGEQGCGLVVAAGGDGTAHEVVNGLMQVPEKDRPALGILPLGSGNDFAHILGIPDDPLLALDSCLSGQSHFMDIGSVRDAGDRLEYFDNTMGIGFDAVVTIRSRKITSIRGFMMYFVATLQTILRNFTPMDLQVETDRESWSQSTIKLTLGNGPREGGGFIVTPQAKLDDGILDYCTIRRISRLTMLRLVPEVMKGTQARFEQVRMGTCRTMTVTSQGPLYVHCDGEIFAGFGTDNRKLTIGIHPNAVRFMKK